MKTVAEMTDFAKGNVEALIESAKAAATASETLATQFVEQSKKSAEDFQSAFQSFSSAKSPTELLAAQNAFAKSQFDKAVANFGVFTESWLKLSGEVMQPLSNRVALATDAVKKSMTV